MKAHGNNKYPSFIAHLCQCLKALFWWIIVKKCVFITASHLHGLVPLVSVCLERKPQRGLLPQVLLCLINNTSHHTKTHIKKTTLDRGGLQSAERAVLCRRTWRTHAPLSDLWAEKKKKKKNQTLLTVLCEPGLKEESAYLAVWSVHMMPGSLFTLDNH